VDEVYPASNRDLARRILKAGGSLLSEYIPGTKPKKHFYPQRNRIISGLARAIVIVEAPAVSGALYTACFALDQGRDLFVASSGVASPLGEGTRRLADEGCPVISHAAEVLAEWGITEEWDEQNRRNGGSLEPGPEKGGKAWLALSLKKELGL
jgi:DNA processing protein